jgi:deoxyribodipyrimidine photo-lyase
MDLFWHRDDLRLPDNRGLVAASADAAVPVYVLDDSLFEYAGAARMRFMLDALAALRADYRERGSDLLVRRGDPEEVLPELADEFGVDRVVHNEAYSGLGRERDVRVGNALSAAGFETAVEPDGLLHEPGSITTNAGDPYQVYTYFWKKWRDRAKDDPLDAPGADSLADVSGDPLSDLDALGFAEPDADTPEAGSGPANERLRDFCDGPIYEYDEEREYPARDATSRISQDLSWGTLGVRETYAETEASMAAADTDADRENVESYQSELAWGEFYTHVLRFNPRVVSEDYNEYENEIAWRNDPDEIAAWKEGKTGYPVVDAGMRQLRAEAYVHNRVRMIVASFLTKDLLCDWRVGYDHFRTHLVDHDTANDNGGWQWAASTGTDAQPYFRIFNPMTQGERYDPDAEYIAEFVPELEGVPADAVHSWHELDEPEREEYAPDYPAPVVEHSERREEAIATFEAARGE